MSDLAIVLVSGGMDSVTVAAIAHEKHQNLAFLHLNYHQKTAAKERECFQAIAQHYLVPKELQKIVDMSFLSQIGGSSLTDQNISVSDYQGDNNNIPSSYVPFRNTHIIALAVSWAETIGAQSIYIGANEEDSPGYPDCRKEYYDAYNKLISLGTKEGKIQVHTPIIKMKKSEIVLKAKALNAPLELTWSCYKNGERACGTCDSCALRLRGFKEAGLQDPIHYQ
ncbi:MAG: 7-cyano-7-deazaguanine synthase QueC [Halobacteriovoraceae bacterium]|nr:7-cyano-7-deazaguanine synthase QueC [Halobacteriovoraceae bacterium]